MSRPRPENFPTRWSYRQARKAWIRERGGSLWTTMALAIGIGLLSGSAVALLILIAVAIVGTIYARSRP